MLLYLQDCVVCASCACLHMILILSRQSEVALKYEKLCIPLTLLTILATADRVMEISTSPSPFLLSMDLHKSLCVSLVSTNLAFVCLTHDIHKK